MKQEDKQLLLKDLCARLPYGVIIEGLEHPEIMTVKHLTIISVMSAEPYKPYLRTMSSMTEDERTEYLNACGNEMDNALSSPRYSGIDWLNAHHFDYRGLIPMGLAIEVTKENNPYKE